MEAASSLAGIESAEDTGFGIDTSFVLFFLAVDLGQNFGVLRFDILFLAITLAAVAVLPYFIAPDNKESFSSWLFGRGLIVIFALVLGLMFKQTLGVVFPESFSLLPMTLLIASALLSCFFQFHRFFQTRFSD